MRNELAAFLAVPAAIQFMQAHGWDAVRERCHALASELRRRLCDWYGVAPLTPDSPEWFAQMFAVLLPPTDPIPLQTRLYEERRVQLSIGTWHDQLQMRVSVQGYNERGDLDAAFAAITDLLPRR